MPNTISGEQAVAVPGNTQTAPKVWAARQKSRRVVQRGGVLYAHEARSMVQQKEVVELEKTEIALLRALSAMTKAQSAEHKPLLKEAKECFRKLGNLSTTRKRQMKALCVEVRKEVCRRSRVK